MELRRVVVTGLGALTPLGNTLQAYWEGLVNGISGAAPITNFDASKFKTRFACEVKGFDPTQFMDRKEARKMDPFTQFAVAASEEAMKDSGLVIESDEQKERAGVVLGSGIGGMLVFQEECINFGRGDGTPRFNPFFIPKMIADSCSGVISMRHGLRGPSYVTMSACASANNALIDSFNYIRMGTVDVMVSGGTEGSVYEAALGGFNAMHALSTRNEAPATASRPYDKDRDGFVMGEGSGILVLEELEHAKARGAKIYCEMVGGGMSSDAYHITAPHPDGLGAYLCMKHALQDARLQPAEIDYINTHGTSTPIGDPQEIKAIQRLFGDDAYRLNISSTKSMTGHLLGAAGAVEAIASIMAICNDVVPPTINHFTDDPEIDPKLNLTFNKAQQRTVNVAMSNTFGFGGHNTSVIFRKYR
ncbi:MAG: beta-ketoacyl-ACP synthase II [Flavobacteriales bacterium]|nr:beta-ketoacyl-ACP synthase II [Flavobacteriales bacterium]MBP9079540.1 beta-ketoacyl-ACP synthase II [Flavobacteriales bacterium]